MFFKQRALPFLTMLVLLAVPPALAQNASVLSDAQRAAVKELVREVIRENPELVLEALNELERRQEEAKAAQAQAAMTTARAALERDADDPVLGSNDADVTVVEFFDYRCPYCKQVTPIISKLLKEDPKIRVVFKEYPILGPASVLAARAGVAANALGKYGPFHDALMAHRGAVDEENLLKIAASVGIPADKMKAEMNRPETQGKIQKVLALGQSIGITGTPAFIVGNQLVPGALSEEKLKSLIAEARKTK